MMDCVCTVEAQLRVLQCLLQCVLQCVSNCVCTEEAQLNELNVLKTFTTRRFGRL